MNNTLYPSEFKSWSFGKVGDAGVAKKQFLSLLEYMLDSIFKLKISQPLKNTMTHFTRKEPNNRLKPVLLKINRSLFVGQTLVCDFLRKISKTRIFFALLCLLSIKPLYTENPHAIQKMHRSISPYLLPSDHPIKPTLDLIFAAPGVLKNEETLLNQGFNVITTGGSYVTIARHPAVPGYVFKLYYDEETRIKDNTPHWEWLVRRCIGAEKIRKVIKKKKCHYLTVPDKWLYLLPQESSENFSSQPILLIATDMEIENEHITKKAWKYLITFQHLDELYAIIKHGYGTVGLVRNIPYTKNKVFAFTDTEYPVRPLKLERVYPYLSKEMQRYWDTLIRQN